MEELPVLWDFYGFLVGSPLSNVEICIFYGKIIYFICIYIYICFFDSRFNLAPLHCTERLIQPAG